MVCRLSLRPRADRGPIVCAGQPERGMQFCAAHGDFQFFIGNDDVAATVADPQQLLDGAAQTGRDVGPYAQPFQYGHRCAISLAVATCFPF